MSFIYITGIAGAGKSEVYKELKKRGYEAHEGDDNLSNFYNNETGEIAERPESTLNRTKEWRKHHTWKMSKEKLLELKAMTETKPVFVCGVASNEDEYIDVFDKVFALDIDTETMKHRINTRISGDFGKSTHEMKTLLEWQPTTADYYKKVNAHVIDATKPVSSVVDEIVSSI